MTDFTKTFNDLHDDQNGLRSLAYYQYAVKRLDEDFITELVTRSTGSEADIDVFEKIASFRAAVMRVPLQKIIDDGSDEDRTKLKVLIDGCSLNEIKKLLFFKVTGDSTKKGDQVVDINETFFGHSPSAKVVRFFADASLRLVKGIYTDSYHIRDSMSNLTCSTLSTDSVVEVMIATTKHNKSVDLETLLMETKTWWHGYRFDRYKRGEYARYESAVCAVIERFEDACDIKTVESLDDVCERMFLYVEDTPEKKKSEKVTKVLHDVYKRTLLADHGDDPEYLSGIINDLFAEYGSTKDHRFKCFAECLDRGAVLEAETIKRLIRSDMVDEVKVMIEKGVDLNVVDMEECVSYIFSSKKGMLELLIEKGNLNRDSRGVILNSSMAWGEDHFDKIYDPENGYGIDLITDETIRQLAAIEQLDGPQECMRMLKKLVELGATVNVAPIRTTLTNINRNVLHVDPDDSEDDEEYNQHDGSFRRRFSKEMLPTLKMYSEFMLFLISLIAPEKRDDVFANAIVDFFQICMDSGMYETTDKFVKLGVDINANEGEMIFLAVQKGDYEQVKHLVNAGAIIDSDDVELLKASESNPLLHRFLRKRFFSKKVTEE